MTRILACAVLLAGCSYDYDKLYEHETSAVADGGTALVSKDLISKWFNSRAPITQECVSCAEQGCAQQNAECMADPVCVEYTTCVGKDPTPAGIASCRAQPQFADWINTKPNLHDQSGPYGQCVFRSTCKTQCAGEGETWCKNQYAWPMASAGSMVPLSLYLVDAIDNSMGVQNLTVRACAAENPHECTRTPPAGMGVTDASGLVKLQLPTDYSNAFTGYFELSGGDRYPTLLQFSWKLGQPTTIVVPVVADQTFKGALAGLRVTPDQTNLGMIQLRMLGCQGGGVKGVHFAIRNPDPRSRTWYLQLFTPTLDATATGQEGQGGIIDVPEGSTNVSALLADDSLLANVDVPVRTAFMTVVVTLPQSN